MIVVLQVLPVEIECEYSENTVVSCSRDCSTFSCGDGICSVQEQSGICSDCFVEHAEMLFVTFESILEPVQLIVLAHVVILFVMQMKQ